MSRINAVAQYPKKIDESVFNEYSRSYRFYPWNHHYPRSGPAYLAPRFDPRYPFTTLILTLPHSDMHLWHTNDLLMFGHACQWLRPGKCALVAIQIDSPMTPAHHAGSERVMLVLARKMFLHFSRYLLCSCIPCETYWVIYDLGNWIIAPSQYEEGRRVEQDVSGQGISHWMT